MRKIKNVNLALEFYKIVSKNPKTNMTWDDFFDNFNIPKKDRSDFGVACIYNKYNKIIEEKKKK